MEENKAPINECPHCKSKDGYYTKEQVHGTVRYKFNFDGTESENDSMYDLLSYKGGKYAYCLRCDKRLFKMEYS